MRCRFNWLVLFDQLITRGLLILCILLLLSQLSTQTRRPNGALAIHDPHYLTCAGSTRVGLRVTEDGGSLDGDEDLVSCFFNL